MDALQNPIVIVIVVAVLVVAVAALVLVRRRRAGGEDALPPPEIGAAIDYTSLPYEEPTSLADRFRNASPAVKALVVLVPLALIGVLAALALAFNPGGGAASQATATPPPPEITDVVAEVVGQGKIVVRARTNLPNGSSVSALMREGDQEFAWFDPETSVAAASGGEIALTVDRIEGAPTPQRDRQYNVALISTLADGTIVQSQPATVAVLPKFEADFYQLAAAAPTPEPAAPTSEPTPAPAEATPAPTAEAAGALTATVRNGANIRRTPSTAGEVVGQVTAGEVAELRARSADGEWYLVRAAAGEGWVSATLLEVPDAAASLPVEAGVSGLTGSVFNGGNVRAAPNLRGQVLDQINAGETVTLLAQNAAGTWYQITNARGITGWVSATLLTVSQEARQQLPVSDASVPVPPAETLTALPVPPTPPAATSVAGTPPSGLTASVFNGGNVRAAPNLQGQVLDQINARETVTLLAQTADGGWYQITNVRGVTGWVNRTLLTVDPEVARRVPVAQ